MLPEHTGLPNNFYKCHINQIWKHLDT